MNPYQILGVEPNSSDDEIKAAYRRLAMKYHPDRNAGDPSAEEKFKEIQSAYDSIKNGTAENQNNNFNFNMGDFFHNMGMGHPWGGFPMGNQDYFVNCNITLEQAYSGCEVPIEHQNKTILINIPAGIGHGTRMVLHGHGMHSDKRFPPGNLFANILINRHPIFTVENYDLVITPELSVFDAMVGTAITVGLINGGNISVRIPAGFQAQNTLRIVGHGMPIMNTKQFGNLLVRPRIVIPKIENGELIKELEIFRNLIEKS